jgi:hypothetical protein
VCLPQVIKSFQNYRGVAISFFRNLIRDNSKPQCGCTDSDISASFPFFNLEFSCQVSQGCVDRTENKRISHKSRCYMYYLIFIEKKHMFSLNLEAARS